VTCLLGDDENSKGNDAEEHGKEGESKVAPQIDLIIGIVEPSNFFFEERLFSKILVTDGDHDKADELHNSGNTASANDRESDELTEDFNEDADTSKTSTNEADNDTDTVESNGCRHAIKECAHLLGLLNVVFTGIVTNILIIDPLIILSVGIFIVGGTNKSHDTGHHQAADGNEVHDHFLTALHLRKTFSLTKKSTIDNQKKKF